MEIVSQLFKTQLRIVGIKREDDKLVLLGDPNDVMPANSSITAREIVHVMGLVFRWQVLLYLLLLPFHYVGNILTDTDLNQKLFTGAYVSGSFLIALLLLSSYRYLATYPLLSALIFFGFALAFFIVFYASERCGFLYPSLVLTAVTYYLLLSGFGIPSVWFPVFSLPLLALISAAGMYFQQQNKEELSTVLFWTGFTLVGYFLAAIWYAGYTTADYLGTAGWVAVLSVLGFALYYGVRARQSEAGFHSTVSLFLVTLAILIELSLLKLSLSFQGLIMVHVGILFALLGTVLQRIWAFGVVRPYYVVGLVLSVGSFLTFSTSSFFFIYGLLICSAGWLVVSELIQEEQRDDDDLPDRASWFKKAYHYLGNTVGSAALVLYGLSGFPVSSLITVAAFGAAGAYLFVAVRTDGAFIQARNPYLYLCSLLTALVLYPLLWIVNPLGSVSWNMVYSIIPMTAILFLGTWLTRHGYEAKAKSAFESINLFVVLGLVLPVVTDAYSPVPALLLTGLFLAMIGAAVVTAYHPSLLYGPVLLAASVIYNVLFGIISSDRALGVVFVLFGITGMAAGVVSYRHEQRWSHAPLFGWIVGMVISLALVAPHPYFLMYTAAGWAVLFSLGSVYLQRSEKEVTAH